MELSALAGRALSRVLRRVQDVVLSGAALLLLGPVAWMRAFRPVREEEPHEVVVGLAGRTFRRRRPDRSRRPETLGHVLRGDLALVGPRPRTPGEVEGEEELRILFDLVRPGATGPWRVHAQETVEPEAEMSLTLSYLQNEAPLEDLKMVSVRWPSEGSPKEQLLNRNLSRARRAVKGVGLACGLLAGLASSARAQCDPSATWSVFQPTGDVAEILIDEPYAWIGAVGGVIRIDLSGVPGGNPDQIKITDNEGLVSTEITCLARDSYGNLWVGTRESGVSVISRDGNLIRNLTSFRELWSDRVIAINGEGDRMVVVSVDSFSSSGTLEGGGFVIIQVTPDGSGGFNFAPIPGTQLEVGQEVYATSEAIWFGTSGRGLWVRDETVAPADFRQELLTELLSANVKTIVPADHWDQSGRDVLWLGTALGLHTYEPSTATLDTVPGFSGENILDMFHETATNTMYVARDSSGVRDIFSIDLDGPLFASRLPRSSCFSDTLYVPRDIAVDAAGRLVLGTAGRGVLRVRHAGVVLSRAARSPRAPGGRSPPRRRRHALLRDGRQGPSGHALERAGHLRRRLLELADAGRRDPGVQHDGGPRLGGRDGLVRLVAERRSGRTEPLLPGDRRHRGVPQPDREHDAPHAGTTCPPDPRGARPATSGCCTGRRRRPAACRSSRRRRAWPSRTTTSL